MSPKNAVPAGNLHRLPGLTLPVNQPEENKKMHTPFTKIATAAFASLVLAAGTAAAQDMRKDQVQDRVRDTNQRINQEYREGQHQP